VQTNLLDYFAVTEQGQEAEAILRSCVHCGFCNATCPTYQQLNDERDGPRGRIYLIKQMLETGEASAQTQTHLDRCLTCRSCETTCPSGVQYGRLADIGRNIAEQLVPRPLPQRFLRWALRNILLQPLLLVPLVAMGRIMRPLLPGALKAKVPPKKAPGLWPKDRHQRKMLVLGGCVQPVTAPRTNAAAARVLDRLGISLIEASAADCCGALSQHLSAEAEAQQAIKRNIDAWWPYIEQGAEAIVMTASGCGVMVKEYAYLMRNDPNYAVKAAQVSALTRDLSALLLDEDLTLLQPVTKATGGAANIAVHCPCTLQHGLKQNGTVEQILLAAGFNLTASKHGHLCCGSAGTYSILQPQLSQRLLKDKLQALTAGAPDLIVSSNIGCQMHLQTQSPVPVSHWIELLDQP